MANLKQNKNVKEQTEGQLNYSHHYNEDEMALMTQHAIDLENSMMSQQNFVDSENIIEQTLSSFEVDNATDADGNPTYKHKSSLLGDIGHIRAAAVSQDEINVTFEPIKEADSTAIDDLNIVFKEIIAKAQFNNKFKQATINSRLGQMAAMLFHWKRPSDPGKEQSIAENPLEVVNLDVKKIIWDFTAQSIEECKYIYEISHLSWDEIVADPILGEKKTLLEEIYAKNHLDNDKFSDDISRRYNLTDRTSAVKSGTNPLYDSLGITLFTKYYLVNKGRKDQECRAAYFIGDGILLADHAIGNMNIPIVIVKEFNEKNAFYGSSKVSKLTSQFANYIDLCREMDGDAIDYDDKLLFVSDKLKLSQEDVEAALISKKPLLFTPDNNTPIQQQVAAVDVSKISDAKLRYKDMMKDDIILQSGVQRLISQNSNSLQTKSALSRADSSTTFSLKATLPLLKESISRSAMIVLDYIRQNAMKLKDDYEHEVKKYASDPMEKGKKPYEFVKIAFANFKGIKADIIPNISLNPEIGKQDELNLLSQLIQFNAQGQLGIDPSYLIEPIIKDLPFSQSLLRNMAMKTKEQRELQAGQIAANVEDRLARQQSGLEEAEAQLGQGSTPPLTDQEFLSSQADIIGSDVEQGQQQAIPGLDNNIPR